ncbi:Uncharacterised protein [Yersinia nurmii]|uniref:Uncharacterized protein n=1 Tax=Yersinia nurmii TaxID=685706 RepID=A0ABP1YJK2_9GAMM|nr:hypothetical protein [Yersinia nurmii]CNF21812.1 Uncharacterised protein [Yersinia nurmii]
MQDPVNTTTTIVWTIRDILYAFGAVISTLAAGVAAFSAYRTVKRDLNSLGDSELKTLEMITKAETDFAKYNAEIMKHKEEKGEDFCLSQSMKALWDVHLHNVLNTYEISCQRFRDGKLDKKRFGKTYARRITAICSSPVYGPIINASPLNFSALLKANIELNDPED